jgi:hypothetical protein
MVLSPCPSLWYDLCSMASYFLLKTQELFVADAVSDKRPPTHLGGVLVTVVPCSVVGGLAQSILAGAATAFTLFIRIGRHHHHSRGIHRWKTGEERRTQLYW